MREYKDKQYWDRVFDGGKTLRSWLAECGNLGGLFDVDRYIDSPMGEEQISFLKHLILYENDEMNPGYLNYWENYGHGLIREEHETESARTRWSSFVPKEYYESADKEKKYPMVLVIHNDGSPLLRVENYGWAHVAAENNLIAVFTSFGEEKQLLHIYEEAIKKYPVDETRIYVTGFSCGGAAASRLAMYHPELFAGVSPTSNYLILGGEYMKDEELQRLRETELPVVSTCGQRETSEQYPLYQDNQFFKGYGALYTPPTEELTREWAMMPITKEQKIESLQRKQYTMNVQPASAEDCLACRDSGDEVERVIGAPFDHTEIQVFNGMKHYIGDYLDEKGQHIFRLVVCENNPHWPSATMQRCAWEFLKKYSRDRKSGKLIINTGGSL